MLEKEFDYYTKNYLKLSEKYNGKFLVIVGESVVGSFDSASQAYSEAQKKYEKGHFLIQECLPTEASFHQTFHSRVS